MRKRLAIAGMVAALAATISLTGSALRDPAESAEASSAPGGTAAVVAALERRDAKDARAYLELGLAYQQLTRETGDAAYYPRSERALRRALALEPRNATTLGALGSLALARHDFRGGLAYGRRAARIAPYSALHYGVIGDAMIELGRYEGAFAAFDRMVELRPSSSAYARVSYARELLGRPQEAEEAMRLGARVGSRAPGALGLGALAPREARLLAGRDRGSGAALPRSARGLTGIRVGPRRARTCRGGPRARRAGHHADEACRRVGVRCGGARRSLSTVGTRGTRSRRLP